MSVIWKELKKKTNYHLEKEKMLRISCSIKFDKIIQRERSEVRGAEVILDIHASRSKE